METRAVGNLRMRSVLAQAVSFENAAVVTKGCQQLRSHGQLTYGKLPNFLKSAP